MTSPAVNFSEGDIEGSILDALAILIPQELQTNIATTDQLRLKTAIEAPLQADPIASAPYFVWGPAYQIGRMVIQDPAMGGFEIGGPELWTTYFMGVCGTPRQNNKRNAYKAINELSRRIERTIMEHYDLSNIVENGPLYSDDHSEVITSMIRQKMWVRTVRRVYGGDGQFYGQSLMIWSYNFQRVM